VSNQVKWIRASKSNPCGACGKFDWCCYLPGKGWLCMRVESKHPAKNQNGWMHFDDKVDRVGVARKRVEVAPRPTIDAEGVMAQAINNSLQSMEVALSKGLGVDLDCLYRIGFSWYKTYSAFAFAMKNGDGKIVGIRLRDMNGRKWAVTGSQQGIFWPHSNKGTIGYIAEGPTDTAAVLSMGLPAIGRPSCNACIPHTLAAIAREKWKRVVILTDNDDPGIKGAMALQAELNIPSIILVPPAKDIREFYVNGGTRELLESIVSQLVWKKPNKGKT
jgi:5S rRNA maturation endonuclease (ribonuclease M5)